MLELPHISNFDDFDPLAREPGVALRYVTSSHELGSPDVIVIPGTKTTVANLRWLRARGLADAIQQRVRRGAALIGICGGYQMLGQAIEDPRGIESAPGDLVQGLGLLPVRTIFEPAKQTHQVRATVLRGSGLLAGCGGYEVTGYEIHMGRTAVLGTGVRLGTAGPAFAVLSCSGAAPAGPPDASTQGPPAAPQTDG